MLHGPKGALTAVGAPFALIQVQSVEVSAGGLEENGTKNNCHCTRSDLSTFG